MEDRCKKCGRFLKYQCESYMAEWGWNEIEGYLPCDNEKCIPKEFLKAHNQTHYD